MRAEPTLSIVLGDAPGRARFAGEIDLDPHVLVQRIEEVARWAAEPVAQLEALTAGLGRDPAVLATVSPRQRLRLSAVASGHMPARMAQAVADDPTLPQAARAWVARLRATAGGLVVLPQRTRAAANRMLALALDGHACRHDPSCGAVDIKARAEQARTQLGELRPRTLAARAALVDAFKRLPPPRPPGPRTRTAALPNVG